ncbi:GTPase HflX [Salinarimonas chemoclinalis]|uniref:GTPase HflX n=1 Tax=Salinarimonas chemoclinalis TaxID=3241599 RepID=UPI003558E5F8
MSEATPPVEERLRRLAEPEKEVASGTPTLVVGPYPTRRRTGAEAEGPPPNPRDFGSRLEEAVGLAGAIDLRVVEALVTPLAALRPATYLGKGKVEELEGIVAAHEIRLVVMDCALSPVQQRNLEKEWGAKVIDRTGLILEIFGRRARTKEGTLQVELAHLNYQKSRLVRSWTHLERQRGGYGFLGGPGETQIEADRRQIQERMTRIERDLETVTRTRALHRTSRRRVPYPIIALVGYTNAGKSTLFNRMTRAEVMAENMLFATLDPTSRAIALPHGEKAILSDTVGFISDLPTMLVAAFRATLEDVIEADVLLHVRDVSHGETQAQAEDVAHVLRGLDIDPEDRGRLIEVWNKADLIDAEERARLEAVIARMDPHERPALVSAVTGEGIEALLRVVEDRIARDRPTYAVTLDPGDGAGVNWLYEQAEIFERHDRDDRVDFVVRIAAEKEPRFLQRFPKARRAAAA